MTLNETQIILYEFICNQTADDGFAYLGDIAECVYGKFVPLSKYSSRSEWRNQHSLKALQRDVLVINKSDAEKRIVPVKHSNKLIGYKIADAEDLDKRIEKYKREALNKWIKARELELARKNNGQLRYTAEDRIKEIKAYLGGC